MKRTRRLMGLAVVAMLVLASVGAVVYAHWEDTLTVEAEVNTGTMDVEFVVGTDDDGNPLNDPSGYDIGDTLATYDPWGSDSTADPRGMYRYNSGAMWEGYVYPFDTDRHDKDVGRCTAEYDEASDQLIVTVTDAYPSYFCSVFFDVVNVGSVPVKLQGYEFVPMSKDGTPGTPGSGYYAGEQDWATTTGLPGYEWDGIHHLTTDQAKGMWCGEQIDPGEAYSDAFEGFTTNTGEGPMGMVFWLHVEQGDDPGTEVVENATMGQTYTFSFDMQFVNWNEWDRDDCPPGTHPDDF